MITHTGEIAVTAPTGTFPDIASRGWRLSECWNPVASYHGNEGANKAALGDLLPALFAPFTQVMIHAAGIRSIGDVPFDGECSHADLIR